MRLWSLVKILAGLSVVAVLFVTALLGLYSGIVPEKYRATLAPIEKWLEKMTEGAGGALQKPQEQKEMGAMLDAADVPDIDLGEKAFQKAHQCLGAGNEVEARERFESVVTLYPSSSSAPEARRVLGEMNLDEVLSLRKMEGKVVHVVKPRESFLGIAGKHETTIDMIMHLNGMLDLQHLRPGEELVVMPLKFRLVIEPKRRALSVWDGGRFIKEYLALGIGGPALSAGKTVVQSKGAEVSGKRVQAHDKEYREALKSLHLAKPVVLIRQWNGVDEQPSNGILLKPEDMEELALLMRVGNEVEIR
jgi:hypothetical protein